MAKFHDMKLALKTSEKATKLVDAFEAVVSDADAARLLQRFADTLGEAASMFGDSDEKDRAIAALEVARVALRVRRERGRS